MFVAEELYSQILQAMPIPCVDLLVRDESGSVLLLLRKNKPEAGQWWFPGGRVMINETREDAAKRKLKEECGLEARGVQEGGTFDLFLKVDQHTNAHFITTLFGALVAQESNVSLDHQSREARWLKPHEWLTYDLPPFVREQIRNVAARGELP